MVDFNAKETIGTPAIDIVRYLWLQARYNLFDAWETYQKEKSIGQQPTLSVVQSRLITLFNEMQIFLERTMAKRKGLDTPYTFDELYTLLYSDEIKEQDIKDILLFINRKLDKIQLIKIDNKQKYDRHDMEAENKVAGLD